MNLLPEQIVQNDDRDRDSEHKHPDPVEQIISFQSPLNLFILRHLLQNSLLHLHQKILQSVQRLMMVETTYTTPRTTTMRNRIPHAFRSSSFMLLLWSSEKSADTQDDHRRAQPPCSISKMTRPEECNPSGSKPQDKRPQINPAFHGRLLSYPITVGL